MSTLLKCIKKSNWPFSVVRKFYDCLLRHDVDRLVQDCRIRISTPITMEILQSCTGLVQDCCSTPSALAMQIPQSCTKSSMWYIFSNHRQLPHLFNSLFKLTTKKLRLSGLCEGNPPVTGGFPSHKAPLSISFSWRHYAHVYRYVIKNMMLPNTDGLPSYWMNRFVKAFWNMLYHIIKPWSIAKVLALAKCNFRFHFFSKIY